MNRQQGIPRDQVLQNDEDDDEITVTCVIPPCLSRLVSSNLPRSASKQKARNNETQNELSQMPRQQKLDLHSSNASGRGLQLDDDKIDYYKRQAKSQQLPGNYEFCQESLRQQDYGNESQFNQYPSSAQSNCAYPSNASVENEEPYTYDDEVMIEDNDQNGPNNYQKRCIQENNQNYFEVNDSQPNRDFYDQNEEALLQDARQSNKSLFHRSTDIHSLMNQIDKLESANAKLSKALQLERNEWKELAKEFEEKSNETNHRVEKSEADAKLSDLKKQFDLYKREAWKEYNADLDHYQDKLTKCEKENDKLKTTLKKQEKSYKLVIRKLEGQIEKLKKEVDNLTADKPTKTNLLPIELSTKSTVDESVQNLPVNVEHALEKDDHLQIVEQEALSMDGQKKVTQNFSELAQDQNMAEEIQLSASREQSLITEAKVKETIQDQAAVVEEETNSEVLSTSNQTFPFKEVKPEVIEPEVIDTGETFSNLPSATKDSTINEESPWLALGITRKEFDASIQAEGILRVESQLKSQRRLNGGEKNRRNASSQSATAQNALSTRSESKRKSSAPSAQGQQRAQKDYYTISKRSRL